VTRVPKAKGRRDNGVAARGRAARPTSGAEFPLRDGAFFGAAGIFPLQTACRCVCRGGRIGRVRYRISRHVRYRPAQRWGFSIALPEMFKLSYAIRSRSRLTSASDANSSRGVYSSLCLSTPRSPRLACVYSWSLRRLLSGCNEVWKTPMMSRSSCVCL